MSVVCYVWCHVEPAGRLSELFTVSRALFGDTFLGVQGNAPDFPGRGCKCGDAPAGPSAGGGGRGRAGFSWNRP